MKQTKRTTAVFLALALALSLCPVVRAAYVEPFDDVPSEAYYAPAVEWAVDSGVTDGIAPTKFGPDYTVTRGQAVTFLWRAMGEPEPEDTWCPFADVKESDYFYDPVLWAVEEGITDGTSDTTFSPADTLTRAHIVTFLWRTAGWPDDNGSDLWYADAVNWATGADLLSGTAKIFAPHDPCPRADVVTYLFRASEAGFLDWDWEEYEDGDEDYEDFEDEEGLGLEGILLYDTEEEHIVSGTLTYEGTCYEGEYVDNELLVMVKDSVGEYDVDEMVEPYGGISLGYIKQVGLYQIVFEESKTLNELNGIISELKKNSNVVEAGLNTVAHYEMESIDYPRDDPWVCVSKPNGWNEKIPGGTNWGFEAINAASARQMVKDYYKAKGEVAPSLKMGIIDGYLYNVNIDGVTELQFEDVAYKDSQYTLADSDTMRKVGESTSDKATFSRYSHGIHVAGIIGAKADNGKGITGIALEPKLYGCSVTDSGSAGDFVYVRTTDAERMKAIATLIQQCGQEYPAIINYSMGAGDDIKSDNDQKCSVLRGSAWMKLFLKTVLMTKTGDFLIVTSAGNGKAPIKDAFYNNEFTCITKDPIVALGNPLYNTDCQDVVDRILVVGAMDVDFCPDTSNSFGARIDVFAPGKKVCSLVPANPNKAQTSEGVMMSLSENSTVYPKDGTSQAAPHVSGTAALVLAADPTMNGAALKKRIVETANIDLRGPDSDGKYHPAVNAAYAVAKTLGKRYTIESDDSSPVKWSLSSEGKLTIQNGGNLADLYEKDGGFEWTRWAGSIKSVELTGDVTVIKSNTFSNYPQLESIILPESVKRIESLSITNCKKLKSVTVLGKNTALEGPFLDNAEGFTLYGLKGSKAEEYANAQWNKDDVEGPTNAEFYNFTFVPLDGAAEPETTVPDGFIPIYSIQDLIDKYNEYRYSGEPHFILMQDIDAKDYPYKYELEGYVLLGNWHQGAILDGNGHTIKNVQYPIFESNNGTIRNLRVSHSSTEDSPVFLDSYSATHYGGIVKYNGSDGLISDCAVSVHMDMELVYGSVCGVAVYNDGVIRNCIADWDTTITLRGGNVYSLNFGGICYWLDPTGTLDHCLSIGRVKIDGIGSPYTSSLCGIADLRYWNEEGATGACKDCANAMTELSFVNDGADQRFVTFEPGINYTKKEGCIEPEKNRVSSTLNLHHTDKSGSTLIEGYPTAGEGYTLAGRAEILADWDLSVVP